MSNVQVTEDKEKEMIEDLSKDIERHRSNTTLANMMNAGFRIEPETKGKGICPCCKKEVDDLAKRKLNTAYVEEDRNWLTSCGDCFEETVSHYSNLWAEHYNSIM